MPNLFFPSSKPRFVNEREVIDGLKNIAQRITDRKRNVEAIYLFGSFAQGNAGIHSDADILVILSQDRRRVMDRLDEFILEFSDGPVPVDVLVYTRAELDAAIKEENRFLADAVKWIKLA